MDSLGAFVFCQDFLASLSQEDSPFVIGGFKFEVQLMQNRER